MTVFVDTMRAPYGRMVMAHMVADTTAELLAMADTIGLNSKHLQHAGTYKEHFDVALSKRKLAIAHGAVEITIRDLGKKLQARRLAIAQRTGLVQREGEHECNGK